MNPQQKADELIKKYISNISTSIDGKSVDEKINIKINSAKQCALICVDEIINLCNKFYNELSFPAEVYNDGGYIFETKELKYWKEVKCEIEKM